MSRYNYFTKARIETNGLKIFISNLDIDLDLNLLATIEDYVSKTKQNPTDKKEMQYLEVNIKGGCLLNINYREKNENSPSGFYLDVGRDFMTEEEISSFDNDDLRSFFNEDDSIYLYDDAELICLVVQYLSMNIFGVPSNQVNLTISDYSEILYANNGNLGKILFKVFIWCVIILLFPLAIFLFGSWMKYEDAELLIGAILSIVSGIWLIKRFKGIKE